MKLDKRREAQLRREVFKRLKRGRPGWDVPHTKAVVYWAKRLADNHPELNPHDRGLLIEAAYTHDVGWSKITIKNNRDSIASGKDGHMEEGAKLTREILAYLGFDRADVEEVARLAGMHDKIDLISSLIEQLLFEADSLGQIDIKRVESTFTKEKDRGEFIKSFKKKRAPRFKTLAGKKFLGRLLPKAEKFYCG